MTIYERLSTIIKATDNPTVQVARNDLSNMLEAIKSCDKMLQDSCGCINYPKELQAVLNRKFSNDLED